MSSATINELARQIWLERVARCKAMTLEQRLAAGGELFDAAVAMSEAGIRAQHPEFDSHAVTQEVRRRLRIQESIEARREIESGNGHQPVGANP